MARSDTETLLSLDEYGLIIGADPRHFNQMVCRPFPANRGEGSVWYQEKWPAPGRASREEAALAIAEAEDLLADVLGYWLAPKYTVDEEYAYPFVHKDTDRNGAVIGLNKLLFIEGGHRGVTLIEEDVDISLSRVDADGDNWEELMVFTVTHADASSWDISEIAVFPHGSPTDTIYQIRGLRVSIAGATITIRGQSPQFVHPGLWDNGQVIDGDDSSVFLTSVDVYRVHTLSTDVYPPVRFFYRDDTAATLFSETQGVLVDVLPRRGLAQAVHATWSGTAWAVSLPCGVLSKPSHVRVSYLSGHPLVRGRIHPKLARAIAALATARLLSPVSGGGDSIEKIWHEWQRLPRDMSYAQQICPFGERQGAWLAWQAVHTLMGSIDGFSL